MLYIRSVLEKWGSVVKECCEGMLWRSVVAKFCREVLEGSVGEKC